MAKNRPGRTAEIRQLLEDYVSIVDAIDTVSDDALARKSDLTAGPAVIIEGEMKFLAQLEKVQGSAPHDLEMYDFDLKEAIASTNDSLDLAKDDLGARGKEVTTKIEKEKKEVADVNSAERRPGSSPAADKAEAAAADAAKPARQAPTLYRPGEKPDPKLPCGKPAK